MEEGSERVRKGSVIGASVKVMKEKNVSVDIKRSLRNSILLPTLMYRSETLMWNRA